MKARQSETISRTVIEATKKQRASELLSTKQTETTETADTTQLIARSMAQLLKLDLPESLAGTGLAQTSPELARLAQLYALGLTH